ncbi:MAG TPA: phage major capsid protein [Oxalobacteraceae bacterium]|nr:phage major capsid protein [Oxalobacteraceae bacterium]
MAISPGQSTLFNTFTELVSTTYRATQKKTADQFSKHNALYRRIAEKGKASTRDGGLSIQLPLEYQSNSTYQRYSGYDTLNIAAVDVLTSAEFPWRQVAINVTASGLELRTNSGDNAFINLADKKLKNAQKSAANGMSVDMYSDGSLSNQIGGLQALVSDLGTGTVGGINSTTYAWWKSLLQSAAAPIQGGAGITMSAATIEQQMLNLWIKLVRGADLSDLIAVSYTHLTLPTKRIV